MSNDVFANSMEVSCKAADGKAICAFPDVCFTPPESPATPPGVPIPYPNTGMASDCTSGSATVKISNQEVMLKNKSYFKKSMGDEAGCAAKKGVITSVNRGKVYFTMWSMDVKVEGENVVRNLDLTTHNHGSVPGNTPTWPYIDETAFPGIEGKCAADKKREEECCADYDPHGDKDVCAELGASRKPSRKKSSGQSDRLADRAAANKCLAARRCALKPYKPASGQSSCCKPQTAHHLLEASAFHDKGRGGKGSVPVAGVSGYKEGAAPCVCAEGATQNVGTHGLLHTYQSAAASKARSGAVQLSNGKTITAKKTTYGTAKRTAIKAMAKVFPESSCDAECISAQLDAYHKQCGINDKTTIKAVETGQSDVAAADKAVVERSARIRQSRGKSGGASV
ncbi:MAG: DUF4150 domain-containing protein [Burkholderiaceae bacterium]|nr:DUF4150 domain-containing protein [Burkholderiaceae bacterium]